MMILGFKVLGFHIINETAFQ